VTDCGLAEVDPEKDVLDAHRLDVVGRFLVGPCRQWRMNSCCAFRPISGSIAPISILAPMDAAFFHLLDRHIDDLERCMGDDPVTRSVWRGLNDRQETRRASSVVIVGMTSA
jgi:hypothetical protein